MYPAAPVVPPVGEPNIHLPPELVPSLDDLITDDGKPLENLFVERQYKLLVDPLYVSWPGPGEGRPWCAMANVGWFHTHKEPPLVPDVLLSLDINPRAPLSKEGRSYIQWVVGKPPDLIIEIVSDTRGGEAAYKFDQYARLKVPVYVIFDPDEHLGKGKLRAFVLRINRYTAIDPKWIEELGLGLTFWEGTYQGVVETWLRWSDRDGQVLLTGVESAASKQRALDEQTQRNDKLREQLRALGADPQA